MSESRNQLWPGLGRHSVLKTFNVVTVSDVQCCKRLMLQTEVQSGNLKRTALRTLFTAKTKQPLTQNYVYAYSNDIHNFATIVLLSHQLLVVLFFLIKFKTLGVELDLVTKLCAKALSSTCVNVEAFFNMSCC